MQRTTVFCVAQYQATWPSAVFRVVLQNLSAGNGFENLIKRDTLVNHFLVSV